MDIPKRGAKNDFLTRLISQIPSKSIRPQSVAFLSPLSLSLSLCCSAVTLTTCGEIRHYLHYLCSVLVPCSREWNKQRSTSSNGNCCGYSGKFCGDYGVSQMRSIFLPTKPQLPPYIVCQFEWRGTRGRDLLFVDKKGSQPPMSAAVK